LLTYTIGGPPVTGAVLTTARLVLAPVGARDLAHLVALKADPLVFGQMLGGVRSRAQAEAELAADICGWGADGFGMWAVRARAGGVFLGITGLMHRPDGRGVALRFALWPHAQGAGLAREASAAALFFAHDRAGLRRVVAVAREANIGSRTILGGVGMVEAERFIRQGSLLLVYESVRRANAG
jgi:RimJ/RimL family protein N-acetyltransferase